jgi:hypothetical protein
MEGGSVAANYSYLRNVIRWPPIVSNLSITPPGWTFRKMKNLDVLIFVQTALAFGVAGLLWPEKFMPLFDVLMFPWPASYRTVRLNSVAAIGLALLLAVRILATT